MEFSDFFDMLWTYLGDPDESKDNKGRPKFFCHLIDLIIRTPQTDVEDKKAELKQLEDENKNYQKKKKLQQDKKDQRDALNATVNNELSEVQHSLNTKMASLNEQVCGSNSFQPPRIELKPKEYNFETINDQGTGTSFKGLIIFDQACLDLTRLPFFVHDSLLFSNIEIDRRNRIVEMYAQETKQIFISIDSIEVLSEKAQEIIRENTVLTLERGGKKLFGRSWNEQATK